jgi:RNA 2',3'-cyclic 3'-phosphodiesterase
MTPRSKQSMLRLFTGIPAPPEVNSSLDEFVRRLKPLAPIRWSPASNFHITTKFIGAWTEERLDELKTALAAMPRPGGFRIAMRGFGFYPNPRNARIFWAGIEGGAQLADLAARTDAVCGGLGIAVEKKPYSPHLTLARIDDPNRLTPLQNALAKETGIEFGEFDARSFHLYLSRPGRGGSVYTSLAEFPL